MSVETLQRQSPQTNEWASDDWGTPQPSETVASSWDFAPTDSFDSPTPQINQYQANETNQFGERLKQLKDTAIRGLGRKALDSVMNRLPSFKGAETAETALSYGRDLVQAQAQGSNFGEYKEQASQFAKNAGREVAGAGVAAAKESVMNYYGLEKDENEKLRVARKLKFGRAVVKTLVNPVGTASSVGVRAGKAARKASKQEAYGQFAAARSSFNMAPPAPLAFSNGNLAPSSEDHF